MNEKNQKIEQLKAELWDVSQEYFDIAKRRKDLKMEIARLQGNPNGLTVNEQREFAREQAAKDPDYVIGALMENIIAQHNRKWEDKFAADDEDGTNCWVWQGQFNNGMPLFGMGALIEPYVRSPRVMLMKYVRGYDIPKGRRLRSTGLCLSHCVNPWHVELEGVTSFNMTAPQAEEARKAHIARITK